MRAEQELQEEETENRKGKKKPTNVEKTELIKGQLLEIVIKKRNESPCDDCRMICMQRITEYIRKIMYCQFWSSQIKLTEKDSYYL